MIEKAITLALLIMTVNACIYAFNGEFYKIDYNENKIFAWLNPAIAAQVNYVPDKPANLKMSKTDPSINPGQAGAGDIVGNAIAMVAILGNVLLNFLVTGYLNAAIAMGVPAILIFAIGVPITFIQFIGIIYLAQMALGSLGSLMGK
jgi:hypothetical protein